MNIIHSSEKIIEFFNSYIQVQHPCFISRIGGSDFELVCDYFNDSTIIYNDAWYRAAVNTVKELNGYFDFNDDKECFKKYLDVMISSYETSDAIAYAGKMEKHFRFYLNKKSDLSPRFKPFISHISKNKTLFNWNQFVYEVHPFLNSFKSWAKGKKILFVSPFSKSIEHQYNFKEHLFLNYSYPDFILKTCNTKVTYNNSLDTIHSLGVVTNNWHEECVRLSREISQIDFDIALLSCGSYAMFLGDFIKTSLHKKAFYFGGVINLYFNIYGEKFKDMFDHNGLNPEYLIEPFENKDIENISGGKKFPNESLRAYFGNKI
jgi:hypothetical protein